MKENTRKEFDNARTKAIRRFGTSNLSFFEYPIFDGWILEINLSIMTDAGRVFDVVYGEIRVSNDGTVTLSHRPDGEFDTLDVLFDFLSDRFTRMIRDYKDYVRIETERLLEAL